MASIFERKDKDGNIQGYRVQVRLDGHPPQSATFKRKTDAKKWAQDIESAIRQGRHFKTTEAKKHSLGDLIDRYIRDVLPLKKKSERKQRAQLLWWKQEIGHTTLADLSPALIGELRDKLGREVIKTGKMRSPSTVVRYMAALSHAFSTAVKEWQWVESSPMARIKKPREPRGRIRFLDQTERNVLLNACKASPNASLYPVVILALSTGMRQGEIMNLKWSSVDLSRGRVILEETKNGQIRAVPITGLALQLLTDLDRKRRIDTHFVFPCGNGSQPVDLRFSWEKALKRSGIENFRFHDLRHSAASELAMNGASLAEIAEVLGHKTLAMVKRYSHLSESHTAHVVEKMNQKIFG